MTPGSTTTEDFFFLQKWQADFSFRTERTLLKGLKQFIGTQHGLQFLLFIHIF